MTLLKCSPLLQSWRKVLGQICICGTFFNLLYIHAYPLSPPYIKHWTHVSLIFLLIDHFSKHCSARKMKKCKAFVQDSTTLNKWILVFNLSSKHTCLGNWVSSILLASCFDHIGSAQLPNKRDPARRLTNMHDFCPPLYGCHTLLTW